MSRSYKKTPYCGLKKHKDEKRRANRKYKNRLDDMDVEDSISPSAFKKMSESWKICDYSEITPYSQHVKNWKNKRNQGRCDYDDDEIDQNWHKWYKRK